MARLTFSELMNPFHDASIKKTDIPTFFQRVQETFNVFSGGFNWQKLTSFRPNDFFKNAGLLDFLTLFIPKIVCYLLLLPIRLLYAIFKEWSNSVDAHNPESSHEGVAMIVLLSLALSIISLILLPIITAVWFGLSALLTTISILPVACVHGYFSTCQQKPSNPSLRTKDEDEYPSSAPSSFFPPIQEHSDIENSRSSSASSSFVPPIQKHSDIENSRSSSASSSFVPPIQKHLDIENSRSSSASIR